MAAFAHEPDSDFIATLFLKSNIKPDGAAGAVWWGRVLLMTLVKTRQVGKRGKFPFDYLSQGDKYLFAAETSHFILLHDDEKFEVHFLTAAVDALA